MHLRVFFHNTHALRSSLYLTYIRYNLFDFKLIVDSYYDLCYFDVFQDMTKQLEKTSKLASVK